MGSHDEPLWTLSATEIAARVTRGELSAVEAVDAHIARIEEVNPPLNAVVVERYDEARAEARASDLRRAGGAPCGPLEGVPVVIKECLDVTGTPATGGLPSLANTLATADERHVARWRAAGAIVLGKTNVAQLLLFIESDNPLYGRTQNPWNLERTPGGSSGGQAAIIAAGGAPIGLGTDIGGSNRFPAAFCGIVGFKPTIGRMPDTCRVSVPLAERTVTSQVGVFARSVADVALGLEVGNGGRAPAVEPPMPLGNWRAVDVSKLRIAHFDFDGSFSACPAARRAVAQAADSLRRQGAEVLDWQPPGHDEVLELFLGLLSADGGAAMLKMLVGNRRDPRIALLMAGVSAGPLLRSLMKVAVRSSGRGKLAALLAFYGDKGTPRYFDLIERTMNFRERIARSLREAPGGPIDVILSPASPLPALRHGATAEVGVMGAYACLMNVLGYPAGVVPVTRVAPGEESDRAPSRDKMDSTARASEEGSAGLPIAVQLAALPWREHVALAAMAAIEARAGFRGLVERRGEAAS